MKMETVRFKITGITPLMQNCSANANLDGGDTLKKKTKPTPEAEAANKVWKDDEGFFHPAIGFRSAMLYAAGGKKIGKRSARAALMASVFVSDEKMRLLDPATGKPLKQYSIDKRMAITKQKTAINNHRPKFEKWGGMLTLLVDRDMVPGNEILLEALNEAGTCAGVGSFRVNCGGWFGRFTVEEV